MSQPFGLEIYTKLTPYKEKMLTKLEATLRVNALDNRGLLTSPRKAPQVAAQLGTIWFDFMAGAAGPQEVENLAVSLVEQGLTYNPAAKGINILRQTSLDFLSLENTSKPEIFLLIDHISNLFLNKVAAHRETLVIREQEIYQASLHQALQVKFQNEHTLTNQLEEQRQKLQSVIDIDLAIASLTNEAELLQQFATLTQEKFLFDGVVIFELGANRQTAVKRAMAGKIPQLPSLLKTISPDSPMGRAISQNQPVATRLSSENKLSDEIFIPLGDSERMLGVLALWIPATAELDPNFELVKALAIVLGATWQNIRLLAQVQERAQDMEILHGQRIQQTWDTIKTPLQPTFIYDGVKVQTQSTTSLIEENFVTIPIQLRDISIGQLRLPLDAGQDWPEEDIAFVESMLREMLTALENSNLVQAIQRRARREQTIREITEKMRNATSLPELVKTTVQELGLHLSAGHVLVDLGIESETD